MIKIISGGKRSTGWTAAAIAEFTVRLRPPFDVKWEILEDAKLNQLLATWPFKSDEVVILTDERGQNISSPEFSDRLQHIFSSSRKATIIIGGAFGVSPEVRAKADFVWSFSRLVFPHQLMRVMLTEQIYRAQEIAHGGKYHHS